MRLGYMVPEFPGQTHIFFWREVLALRRLGEEVVLLSTRKPLPLNCRHAFASEAIAETRYLFPPNVSNLSGWIREGAPGFLSAQAYRRQIKASNLKNQIRHFGLLASAIDLAQWARQHRIDHIHGHSCADTAHVLALAKRIGGPPFSLTLHGDLDVYGQDHRLKMAEAAFICTVGAHLRQQVLERAGVAEDRVLVTCMGLETSQLSTLGKDRSYKSGSLHVVTVARLEQVKGHLHALAAVYRAVEMGLDIQYTIAGDGSFREAIVARIRELGLERRVSITGTLAEHEVFELLSKADAFVLPSTGVGEAWPVSVMEAMSAGLPVVASIIGATPQMIRSGVDGLLVPQHDENALLQQFSLLACDPEMRRTIGKRARKTASLRFDVAATAAKLRNAVHAYQRQQSKLFPAWKERLET